MAIDYIQLVLWSMIPMTGCMINQRCLKYMLKLDVMIFITKSIMAIIDIVRHEILIFTGSPNEISSPLAAIGVDPKGLEEKHRPTTLDQRCGRRRGLKSFLGCAETRTKHEWVMERLGTDGPEFL